jgi:hypothetical protein
MDSDIGTIFVDVSVATRLLMDEVYGPKNVFSEFIVLGDTNYRFTDLKMHFQSLWTYIFKVYGSKRPKLQVEDRKMHF